MLILMLAGCSSVATKSWGMASSSDAFRALFIDPAGGKSAPELIAGGGCVSMLFMKPFGENKIATGIAYSRRKSMWGMFSGSNVMNVSIVYISGSDETPEQTIKILKAFSKVVNSEVPGSGSTAAVP